MPSLASRLWRLPIRYLWSQLFHVDRSVRWQRRMLAALRFSPAPGTARTRVSDPVIGEWLRPRNATPGQAMLYLHGGGYTIGSPASHRWLVAQIARATRIDTFVLEYRLAPEHPFPAALDDTLAAYAWLRAQAGAATQIVIAGDSAGGGLAVAAALALRDAGQPLPAAVIGLSAWVDLACAGESLSRLADIDPVLTNAYVQRSARDYLGQQDPRAALASPLYAALTGLPPMLLQVGTDEILFDDSLRLAVAARRSGIDVTLDVWPGMWHGWQALAPFVPESRQAIAKIAGFAQRALAGVPQQ